MTGGLFAGYRKHGDRHLTYDLVEAYGGKDVRKYDSLQAAINASPKAAPVVVPSGMVIEETEIVANDFGYLVVIGTNRNDSVIRNSGANKSLFIPAGTAGTKLKLVLVKNLRLEAASIVNCRQAIYALYATRCIIEDLICVDASACLWGTAPNGGGGITVRGCDHVLAQNIIATYSANPASNGYFYDFGLAGDDPDNSVLQANMLRLIGGTDYPSGLRASCFGPGWSQIANYFQQGGYRGFYIYPSYFSQIRGVLVDTVASYGVYIEYGDHTTVSDIIVRAAKGDYCIHLGSYINMNSMNISAYGYAKTNDGIRITGPDHNVRNVVAKNCNIGLKILSGYEGSIEGYQPNDNNTDLSDLTSKYYLLHAFKKTTQSVTIGLSGVYGAATSFSIRRITSLMLKLTVAGVAGGETITVKVELVWASGNTTTLEKDYVGAGGSAWLTDDELLGLWRDGDILLTVNVYAKTDQVGTAATVDFDIRGGI